MAPEMAAHFRRAVHVHLIVDVQFSRTGVLPVMNRYQQRIVQINWICLKRSILQSPRSCKAIGCQARHAVSTGYRSINWKRQVSICPLQLHIASFCIALHRLALCCTILHHLALSCIVLHHLASSCTLLHRLALSCIVLHHLTKSRIILHCLASSCKLLRHLALSCIILHTETPRNTTNREDIGLPIPDILQTSSVHISIMMFKEVRYHDAMYNTCSFISSQKIPQKKPGTMKQCMK